MRVGGGEGPPDPPSTRAANGVTTPGGGGNPVFTAPRRFGLMLLAADEALPKHKLFKGLGPEPLDDAFDGAALAKRLKGRRTPIKAALLDQKTLVGVGNIYACEAWFLAGISPRRSAPTVQR